MPYAILSYELTTFATTSAGVKLCKLQCNRLVLLVVQVRSKTCPDRCFIRQPPEALVLCGSVEALDMGVVINSVPTECDAA